MQVNKNLNGLRKDFMAKCISKKYLKSGDKAYLKDGGRYGMKTTKAIANFHNDEGKVEIVVRKLSVNSPYFIGIFTDEKTKQEKIAFWITKDQKYATSDFYKSEKHKNKYNIVLWRDKGLD